jgi:hypothetical protein
MLRQVCSRSRGFVSRLMTAAAAAAPFNGARCRPNYSAAAQRSNFACKPGERAVKIQIESNLH